MQLADDGFGNLISTEPAPDPGWTRVYAPVHGVLRKFDVATSNHQLAINTIRKQTPLDCKPVLALIPGGRL